MNHSPGLAMPMTGTQRQRQAAATKETITRTALTLFAEQGYARTTIESIARHARVSVATVYAIFGSKRQILVEIRRLWFREAELSDYVEQAMAEPDAAKRLGLAARWIRHQLEVGATIAMIIDEAIRSEPNVARMWSALRLVADDTISRVIGGVADQLAPSVSAARAVDIVWALSRAAVYRELIDGRGWTPDEYEQWLAATLRQQLLGSDESPGAFSKLASRPATATD
jgi:AcrR family transcriptional regulator